VNKAAFDVSLCHAIARGGGCLRPSVFAWHVIIHLLVIIRHELDGREWRDPRLIVAWGRREARRNGEEVINVPAIAVTAGWYVGPVLIDTSSPPDGTLGRRRWLHHHRRMVHRTGVDGRIITVGWYAGPASMVTSSSPDRTPDRCRWTHHHRRMVRQAGVNGYIITTGLYARPTVVKHRHRRMLRGTDGGKILSPPERNRRR
jgi:hypothetical protein